MATGSNKCVTLWLEPFHTNSAGLAKCDGYRPSISGNKTSLIFHVILQDNMSKDLLISWKEAHHYISPLCQIWQPQAFCSWIYKDFSRSRNYIVMQYEQKPLDLSSHPVKPRRHRHCSSGDIMHDQGAMQSDGCGPPAVSHTSAKLGGHKHRGPRDIMDLARCMSLQLHVTKYSTFAAGQAWVPTQEKK